MSVQFDMRSTVPYSTKKHQKARVVCLFVYFYFSLVWLCRMIPSPSLCFWCFSCFSCFLVLFRSWYVWPWFIKHQKAPKSTTAVFFNALCCELDCSTKHHKAPKSTTTVAFAFSLYLVSALCQSVAWCPPPPPSPPPLPRDITFIRGYLRLSAHPHPPSMK